MVGVVSDGEGALVSLLPVAARELRHLGHALHYAAHVHHVPRVGHLDVRNLAELPAQKIKFKRTTHGRVQDRV